MSIFSQNLKNLRIEFGLSQMELSIKVSIPQASIARYELAKTEPRVSEIVAFCRFFEVSADYLLGLSDW